MLDIIARVKISQIIILYLSRQEWKKIKPVWSCVDKHDMQGTEIFFVTLQLAIVSIPQKSHYFYLQLTAFLNPTQESLWKQEQTNKR